MPLVSRALAASLADLSVEPRHLARQRPQLPTQVPIAHGAVEDGGERDRRSDGKNHEEFGVWPSLPRDVLGPVRDLPADVPALLTPPG